MIISNYTVIVWAIVDLVLILTMRNIVGEAKVVNTEISRR